MTETFEEGLGPTGVEGESRSRRFNGGNVTDGVDPWLFRLIIRVITVGPPHKAVQHALKAQKRHIFEVSPNVDNGSFKPLNAYSTFVDALLKEFVVNGKKIELNRTLDHSVMVINIGISEIPLMEEEVLKTALINTFERFGDILNIGISKCADSDWFTGRGFATLNRNKLKEATYAAELTLQVELVGFPGVLQNIVWSQMKPICTDCHTDEHIKFDCPKRMRKLCFRCKSPNHLQAKCPTAPWNREPKANKQAGISKIGKSVPEEESSMTSDFKTTYAAGTRREINLLDLLKNDTKPQAVGSETTIWKNEPSQPMKEAVPTKSVSTPRSSRSQQTKKLDDIITLRHSVSLTSKERSKLNRSITKRNLEDALSPETRESLTPNTKRLSKNMESETVTQTSSPSPENGGEKMN
ncbi:uncharacterized protein B0P05DRAFT_641647, partial [Gilbertella persicaria]|uniref:uncharacterized protein n=1 Tax=Gilbertella persicaria TaxID=101096 RepID=UPI0022200701